MRKQSFRRSAESERNFFSFVFFHLASIKAKLANFKYFQVEDLESDIEPPSSGIRMAEVEDFLLPLDPDFMCAICEGVLVKPMCCREGHPYCDECIQTWLINKSECPMKCGPLIPEMLSYNRPLEKVDGSLKYVLYFLLLL